MPSNPFSVRKSITEPKCLEVRFLQSHHVTRYVSGSCFPLLSASHDRVDVLIGTVFPSRDRIFGTSRDIAFSLFNMPRDLTSLVRYVSGPLFRCSIRLRDPASIAQHVSGSRFRCLVRLGIIFPNDVCRNYYVVVAKIASCGF